LPRGDLASAARTDACVPGVLDGCKRIDASGFSRWSEAEEHDRQDRRTDTELQHAPVDAESQPARKAERRDDRKDPTNTQFRQDQSEPRRRHTEDDVFRQELSDDPSALRAQGHTDGDLAATRGGAREQDVRDVAAGDQQDDASQPEEAHDDREHAHERRTFEHLRTRKDPPSREEQRILPRYATHQLLHARLILGV
jgi:hypothetical protein